MNAEHYSRDFYQKQQDGSRQSAEEVVPLILKLIKPQSVIDIGCGVGTWLSVFKEHGVDIWGIDSDWVNKDILHVPKEHLIISNLEEPVEVQRKFDLAISLEVAEHLKPSSAEIFVDSLTRLAPVVLFSAAIPGQGGYNHINEQWPDYWAKLFHDRGYEVVDCLRKKIWKNEKVDWWYAQNILLFVAQDYLQENDLLKKEQAVTFIDQLSLIHPKAFSSLVEYKKQNNLSQKKTVSKLLKKIIKKLFKT